MDNYFDFFDLEPSFQINHKALRSAFILNSKKYHPDFHTHKSEEVQDRVLELSTINNKAWKTLSDDQKRVGHILDLYHIMPEEGKAQVPQSFLMEMMDINEVLMELEFDGDAGKKEEVLKSLQILEQDIEAEGKAAMDAWDEDREVTFLELVKDYYLKIKYIRRIRDRLGTGQAISDNRSTAG